MESAAKSTVTSSSELVSYDLQFLHDCGNRTLGYLPLKGKNCLLELAQGLNLNSDCRRRGGGFCLNVHSSLRGPLGFGVNRLEVAFDLTLRDRVIGYRCFGRA